MNNNLNKIKIIVLVLATVALSIYTLIGTGWWLGNMYKLPKLFTVLLFPLAIVIVIVGPLFLLGYFIYQIQRDKSKEVNNSQKQATR
jgi:hypothetical protein